MALSSILRIYRARLRVRIALVQELLAVVGLAVGVALLFASQVASTSLNHSVAELSHDLVGNMQLQLQARSPHGFDKRLLSTVERIPGVAEALPVLEEQADVIGPRGRESVELLGTNPRFAHSGGPLLRHFSAENLAHQQELGLPAPVARAIGAESLQPIEIQVGTHVSSTLVGATLQEGDIGGLVHSPVAIAPVGYAERLAGAVGRVTRIFVRTRPGQQGRVRAALARLAAGRLNVEPADFDTTLFAKAAGPANQAAELFSAISALVGFMFAFNALLITAQLRRDLIGELRRHGATRWMTISTLLFDAFVLGTLGCLLGLLLGDVVSAALFPTSPGYLAYAFPVGSQRVVTWQSVAVATAAGMLAAAIGVLVPLRGELARPLRAAAPTAQPHIDGRRWLHAARTITGLLCLAATTAVLLFDPADAILGSLALAAALLLLLAPLFDGAVATLERASRPLRSVAMRLAVIELRTPTTRTRSLAIAATGAIAVFGSVAIQGARGNLQRGLDRTASDMNRVSDVWVSAAGSENTLGTTPFAIGSATSLQRLPGVRSLALYRGGFLDIGDRRAWVIAPPRSSPLLIPGSELLRGSLTLANARLREGGWAVVSQAIADERHLYIGDSFLLPSPRPTRFRIAALSTNVGWPPGAVFMNSDDYARAWGSAEASAYNITLQPGIPPSRMSAEIRRALGPHSGLSVQTALQRELEWRTSSRQGLARISQIALLVLLAAVLAVAGAMAAMIWQRRPQLAYLKRQGYLRGVLWRALLYESLLLLGSGCAIGAVFGIYGQLLLSHALAGVTGFPVVFSIGALVAVWSVALVSLAATTILALPGYLAARVRPSVNPG
ncbi:MAG TPA: FtsX-like permease family protein [Solirubrobacteraceae bacterium]|jgi:putative ABC transport system permease protein|nr:FtsX-like permease family protein [Solirubrobacteraceae bacterium]